MFSNLLKVISNDAWEAFEDVEDRDFGDCR